MTDTLHRPDAAAQYVPYEYLTIRMDSELEPLYRDTYRSLGWQVEDRTQGLAGHASVALKLKRDRRIEHRAEVAELQRSAERSLASIASLERSKGTKAMATSLILGILGSAFLAGSVFAIQAGAIVLSIPLGTIGLVGWVLGYVSHGRVRDRSTVQAAPAIDREYENLYSIGDQATRILR